MQKRVSCLMTALVLFVTMSVHAAAAESSHNIVVNGQELTTTTVTKVINQNTYVSYWPVVSAMFPDATISWENGQSVVRANGLTMCVQVGAQYIVVNGRYLYVPNGVQLVSESVLLPAQVLAKALGAIVGWDGVRECAVFQSSGTPLASGDSYYYSDSVYWLSRIIYAESGNQPLEGKIAVGNVILNRVADSRFPNTITGVIFQPGQFTPAQSGSLNRTPNTESVIAAKLCLDGANTAGNSLYFVNPSVSPNSWASRNCTCVATIGAHAFFA